jgi:hypothetical protein
VLGRQRQGSKTLVTQTRIGAAVDFVHGALQKEHRAADGMQYVDRSSTQDIQEEVQAELHSIERYRATILQDLEVLGQPAGWPLLHLNVGPRMVATETAKARWYWSMVHRSTVTEPELTPSAPIFSASAYGWRCKVAIDLNQIRGPLAVGHPPKLTSGLATAVEAEAHAVIPTSSARSRNSAVQE